jgi:hypothetical protein
MGFIAPFRAAVLSLVEDRASVAVYSYLPNDVTELPCYVVGRPSVRESGTAAVMTLTLDVTLLGRRISDEDAQAELDVLADELFDLLGGTRNVFVDSGHLRCTGITPGMVVVAGLETPAYVAGISMDALSC